MLNFDEFKISSMTDKDGQSLSHDDDQLVYLGYIEQGDLIEQELGFDYRDPEPGQSGSNSFNLPTENNSSDNSDPPWLVNKLGGLPTFPFVDDDNLARLETTIEEITCITCKKSCVLVFQIKGSIDDSELNRIVQVYACVDTKCSKHTWTALRCLFPHRANKATDLKPKFLKVFEDEALGTILVDESRLFFRPHYVSVIEEPTGRENFASTNLEALKLASKFTDLDLNPAPIEAKYKNLKNYQAPKPPAHLSDVDEFEKFQLENLYANDKSTYRFYKRLRRFQGQVVRYDWGGEPLLSSNSFKFRPTACHLCQSKRQFEFQLMPASMNYLTPVSTEIKDSFDRETIDFCSIIISSCSKNCSDVSEFNLEEAVYMPDPDRRSYNKVQQRLTAKVNGKNSQTEDGDTSSQIAEPAPQTSGRSNPNQQSRPSKRRNRRKK